MNIILITDIGDSAVLGGATFAGIVYLLISGCRKGAAALALSFLGAAISIGLIKLLFIGCDGYWRNYNINSPSGHAALSVAVLGTYGLLIASQLRKGWWRLVPVMLFVALAVIISITRVKLGVHSIMEVVIGILVGGGVLSVVRAFLSRGDNLPKFNAAAFSLSVILVAFILHGFRLPAEILIRFIASYIKSYVSLCAVPQ